MKTQIQCQIYALAINVTTHFESFLKTSKTSAAAKNNNKNDNPIGAEAATTTATAAAAATTTKTKTKINENNHLQQNFLKNCFFVPT